MTTKTRKLWIAAGVLGIITIGGGAAIADQPGRDATKAPSSDSTIVTEADRTKVSVVSLTSTLSPVTPVSVKSPVSPKSADSAD